MPRPQLPISLDVSIQIRKDDFDPSGLLSAFSALFSSESESGRETEVGGFTGWLGLSVAEEDISDSADAVSSDSSYIGAVAATLLKEGDLTEDYLEDVILLDRLWITEDYRGLSLLEPMLEELTSTLRLDVNGCLVVTEPEPQQPGGGPYPEGPVRDKAMTGLRRVLRAAGFTAWRDGRAEWAYVVR